MLILKILTIEIQELVALYSIPIRKIGLYMEAVSFAPGTNFSGCAQESCCLSGVHADRRSMKIVSRIFKTGISA